MCRLKKNVLLIILSLIFVAGCQETRFERNASSIEPTEKQVDKGCNCSTAPLSSIEGLINYIAPMPAVWDIKPWKNPYSEKGLMIETVHYKIYTTLMEPLMLRQVPAFVEAAYSAYQSQLPSPAQTPGKLVIYLFDGRRQWESFTKGYTGQQWPIYQKIKRGAYYLDGACVAYNIGRSRTFSVIGHEGWHQFCDSTFKYRLPSWLDEGIAQLFETSEYDGRDFVFTQTKNYNKLGSLRLTLQNNRMIPLSRLISLNPGEVVMWEKSSRATMAFYAQSYALVRFLREDDYGRRFAQYQQMLLGAFNGSWPLDASEAVIASDRSIKLTARWNSYIAQKLFAVYIGQDIEKIEPAYLRFCKKIVYNIRVK
ncbi:MAG: DUF1570 domain-containing protein [Anaerohalosphaeraceae bacterium]|nr:DUF1570 domain-containing protein [Anaerohalosphaeraceae bacterium]